MDYVICDKDALRFWLGPQGVTRTFTPNALCSRVENMGASSKLPWERLNRLGFTEGPLHLLVPEQHAHRFSSSVITHLWRPPYPEETFVKLAPNIYILSPVASLVRVASSLSFAKTMQHAYQLVGTYRIDGLEIRNRPALTTPDDIRRYVDAASGVRGTKRMRLVKDYLVAGAASPEEANVVILLVAPCRMGGYGLPLPVLNKPIKLTVNGKSEERRPDTLWEADRIILEYLGDRYHNRLDRYGPDAARKTHLQEAGYTVIDVTKHQTASKQELDSIVAVIRTRMNLPPLVQSEEFARRNEQLRAELFERRSA